MIRIKVDGFLFGCGWLVGWLTSSMLTKSLLSLHCLGDTVHVQSWEMISRTGDLAGICLLGSEQAGRDIGNGRKMLGLAKLHSWQG